MTTKKKAKKTTKKAAAPKASQSKIDALRAEIRDLRAKGEESAKTIFTLKEVEAAQLKRIRELDEQVNALGKQLAEKDTEVRTAIAQRDEAYQRGLDAAKQATQPPPAQPV